MTASVSPEQDEVLWCAACGIPHEASATHCNFCNRPLIEQAQGDDDATGEAIDASDAQTGALARAIADRAAAQRAPRQPRVGPWALPRRPQPLSDDEIDAQAAAIVAQARKEESDGETENLFPAGSSSLSDAELISQLDFLPPLRRRDREWLLAGLFCCVILIIGAVIIVRFFAL